MTLVVEILASHFSLVSVGESKAQPFIPIPLAKVI
jgi:hypothetical protein